MAPTKTHRLLLILPLAFLFVSVLLLNSQGPYYLGAYLEDYPYLLNGLNILLFHSPGHTDHPGTTLQLLAAVVLFCKWLASVVFGSWSSLQDAVLSNPEEYLHAISISINVLAAALMYIAGRAVLRLTNSWVTAIVLQLSPFLFFEVLVTQIRVQNEPLLTISGLALAIPLLQLVLRSDETSLHTEGAQYREGILAVVAGIIFAFGVISKVTFLPLGLLVFLFAGRRAKALFALSAIAAALVFLLPVITQLPRMSRWFVSLMLHSERYGGGAVGLPSANVLANGLAGLYGFEPALFWFFPYYLTCMLVVVVAGRRYDPTPVTSRIGLLLAVGCTSLACETALTVKAYAAPHYLVGGLAIVPLLNAAIVWYIGHSRLPSPLKGLLLVCGLILVSVDAHHVFVSLRTWTLSAQNYRDEIRRIEVKLAQESDCVTIPNYRSSIPGFGLAFGNDFAGGVHSSTLARLYPDLVYLHVFDGRLHTFSSTVPLETLRGWLSQGRCVLLEGTPLSPEVKAYLPGVKLEPVLLAGSEGIFRLDADLSYPGALVNEAPPHAVVYEAEHFSTGTVVGDNSPAFGAGIGVVTSPRYPAYAEYTIPMQASGRYEVLLRYASEVPRPVRFYVNGKLLTAAACSEPTGGYGPQWQRWQRIGVFDFLKGSNTVRLSSDQPFPHIDKLAFVLGNQR